MLSWRSSARRTPPKLSSAAICCRGDGQRHPVSGGVLAGTPSLWDCVIAPVGNSHLIASDLACLKRQDRRAVFRRGANWLPTRSHVPPPTQRHKNVNSSLELEFRRRKPLVGHEPLLRRCSWLHCGRVHRPDPSNNLSSEVGAIFASRLQLLACRMHSLGSLASIGKKQNEVGLCSPCGRRASKTRFGLLVRV